MLTPLFVSLLPLLAVDAPEGQTIGTHVWAVIKILLMILLAIAVLFWWLRRQA